MGGCAHASLRLFRGPTSAPPGRAAVQPGGEEQRGRARRCARGGEAGRGRRPAPTPPRAAAAPPPPPCPPRRREMAATPQNGSRARSRAGARRDKTGAAGSFPRRGHGSPGSLVAAVRRPPPALRTVPAPRPYSAFPHQPLQFAVQRALPFLFQAPPCPGGRLREG